MNDPRANEDIARVVRNAASGVSAALVRAGEVAAAALEGMGVHPDQVPSTPLGSNVRPHLTPADPRPAGEEHHVRVSLTNGGKAASEPFKLRATQLKSDGGDKIPANAVTVPKEKRVLAGNASDTVAVTVDVPADAKPGTYTGKLNGGPEPAELTVVVG